MISVTILVKNGERLIEEVLTALKDFPEIILLDTGSTDRTLEIGSHFPNVKVVQRAFKGFGESHNEAASLAQYDWILSLDADEVIGGSLAKEILSYKLELECVYALKFENYFNGRKILWCGWHPETHVRLYNRTKTGFSDRKLHEKVIDKGFRIVTLKGTVFHFSYETISDFLVKMERYSSLFAEEYKHKKRSSLGIALYHGLGGFLKSYFVKKGFLGGYEGFIISLYQGHTAFYKYLKLHHANQSR